MTMKKLITVCLILSLNLLSYAQASASPSQAAPTEEETLLARVYQIAGSQESTEQERTELQSAVQVYADTSSAEGREQRLTDALVSMQVFSPEQARELTQQAAISSETIVHQKFASQEQQTEALQTELSLMLSQMPHGAQFSGCNEAVAGLGVFLIGSGALSLFSSIADNNNQRFLEIGAGLVVIGVVTAVVSTHKCTN
jgi:hypothetical protein